MPYDEDLADRVRELLGLEEAVSERRMFGGVAFLVGGHLAIAASGQGGILVRVDPAQAPDLVRTGHAAPAVMRGREMDGWLRVPAAHVRTTRQLGRWVRLGVARVRALPAKGAPAQR